MMFVSEIETVPRAGVFQLWCAIDEKHGVDDAVFLTEFVEEYVNKNVCSRLFKVCV